MRIIRRTRPDDTPATAIINARDFDAIRAMISDDVRLDVASKTRFSGKVATIRDFRHVAYGAKYSV
jgi:hypothetical protein